VTDQQCSAILLELRRQSSLLHKLGCAVLAQGMLDDRTAEAYAELFKDFASREDDDGEG
jgi:hypothetical protein